LAVDPSLRPGRSRAALATMGWGDAVDVPGTASIGAYGHDL